MYLNKVEKYISISRKLGINSNYSMSPSWIWSDKITNKRVARVGYYIIISYPTRANGIIVLVNSQTGFCRRFLFPQFYNFRSHAPRLQPSPDYYITKSWWTESDSYANDNLSSTCGERKPSSNYLTGQIQGKQTILEVFKCEESVNLAHYFPYDVKTPTMGS